MRSHYYVRSASEAAELERFAAALVRMRQGGTAEDVRALLHAIKSDVARDAIMFLHHAASLYLATGTNRGPEL